MNEKIKALATQAGMVMYPTGLGISENTIWGDRNIAKFAELLIQECMTCCERVISDPVPSAVDTWLNGGLQCIDEIKHNFGIEK